MNLWKSVRNAVSRWRDAGRETRPARGPAPANVHQVERVLCLTGGIGLGIGAARSRGPARLLLAALSLGLVWRGVTGRSRLYGWLGVDTTRPARIHGARGDLVSRVPDREGITLHTSMVIDRPLDEVFAMWRDFEALSERMTHIESVHLTGPTTSRWIARGPFGFRAQWDAEIVEEVENERIAWRSLPGSDIMHVGSLSFEPAQQDRTVLHVHLKYSPLGGPVGAWVSKLFGRDPSEQIHEDLLRFKDEVEGRPPRGPMIH